MNEKHEIRLEALKLAAQGRVVPSKLIELANEYELYILNGFQSGEASAEGGGVPVTEGKAPPKKRRSRASTVPDSSGEASDQTNLKDQSPRLEGRPSQRGGIEVTT